jgi:hypothetical protein
MWAMMGVDLRKENPNGIGFRKRLLDISKDRPDSTSDIDSYRGEFETLYETTIGTAERSGEGGLDVKPPTAYHCVPAARTTGNDGGQEDPFPTGREPLETDVDGRLMVARFVAGI